MCACERAACVCVGFAAACVRYVPSLHFFHRISKVLNPQQSRSTLTTTAVSEGLPLPPAMKCQSSGGSSYVLCPVGEMKQSPSLHTAGVRCVFVRTVCFISAESEARRGRRAEKRLLMPPDSRYATPNTNVSLPLIAKKKNTGRDPTPSLSCAYVYQS